MPLPRVPIPPDVKSAAAQGLALHRAGYAGGTATGFFRAEQLVKEKSLPPGVLRTMRAWFARHGPAASNGGTSFPGYKRYLRASAAEREAHKKTAWRGAVAWLLWGGTPALRWLQSPQVRAVL
jgi:hypothetical protein